VQRVRHHGPLLSSERGLGVSTYEARVVVGCAGCLHAAECNTSDAWQQTSLPDQPVGVGGCLVLCHLLGHDAKDVRDVLIQGSGLTLIHKGTRVLGDGVLKLLPTPIPIESCQMLESTEVNLQSTHAR
jgi:hypothetical protein